MFPNLTFLVLFPQCAAALDFSCFISYIIITIIKPLIWLIMALAVVYFLWNVAESIRKSDQPDELAKFRSKAFWGIIALAVMVSLWGLVNILVNTFAGPAININIPLNFLLNR